MLVSNYIIRVGFQEIFRRILTGDESPASVTPPQKNCYPPAHFRYLCITVIGNVHPVSKPGLGTLTQRDCIYCCTMIWVSIRTTTAKTGATLKLAYQCQTCGFLPQARVYKWLRPETG